MLLAVESSGQEVAYADLSAATGVVIQDGCVEGTPVVLPAGESELHFTLDAAKVLGNCVELSGWCHVGGQDATKQQVVLVLDSAHANAGFAASRLKRADVSEVYRKNGSTLQVADAGYTVLIPRDALDNSQKMGVLITLPGGKSHFKWVNKPKLQN
jgi:hypothetical protein